MNDCCSQNLIGKRLNTGSIIGGINRDPTGFVVEYLNSTTIKITAGYIQANDKVYELASNTSHVMTSLASAFDHHYIYIDDDASSAPTPTFIDSTTEPSYTVSKRGWYNGDDRCIGVMSSPAGSATLMETVTSGNRGLILNEMESISFPVMAQAMNPSDTWQDPNINNSDVLTPLNASRLRFIISNTDANSNISAYVGASEISPLGGPITYSHFFEGGFNRLFAVGSINLGASRNVRLSGANANDNNLQLRCMGYAYER